MALAAELAARAEWQLVDVREAWEIEIASVQQSIHIPMAEIPSRQSELDADAPVAVLCHSGGRSARVAAFLCNQGFSRVANVAGGIDVAVLNRLCWKFNLTDIVI
jgi:rhodanese-related sulfurtransferase